MIEFRKEDIISANDFSQITDIRVDNPETIPEIAGQRKRREKFAASGRLNIVAADHPARGSVAVGDDAFAMADRHDLLARLVHVLRSQWVDGVLASMDLLEELLVLHNLMKENGQGFLDEKLMIASLNRGGHPGAAWELNDPITGTDAQTCRQLNLDAAKMLLRIESGSRDSLKTLLACAEGVRTMSEIGRPIFLEPLPVQKQDEQYRVLKDPDLLVELAGITAALGNTSRYIWLKLPYTDAFERVVQATTLPIVILGGGKRTDLTGLLTQLHAALASGQQVRGAMFGRNLLYPDAADAQQLADAIGRLVHGKSDLEEALEVLNIDE